LYIQHRQYPTVTVATAVRPRIQAPVEFGKRLQQAVSLCTHDQPIQKGLQTPLSAVRLHYDFEQLQNIITKTCLHINNRKAKARAQSPESNPFVHTVGILLM